MTKDAAEESEEPGKGSEVMAVSTKKKWWKPGNPLKSLSNPFRKGSRVRTVPGKNGEAGENEVGDFANGFTNLVTKKEGQPITLSLFFVFFQQPQQQNHKYKKCVVRMYCEVSVKSSQASVPTAVKRWG